MQKHGDKSNTRIYALSGILIDGKIYETHRAVREAIADGFEGLIVLDFKGVTAMDSRALGALISMWKMVDTDKIDLVIYKPQGLVKDLLFDTNLSRVIKIVNKY